MEGLHLEGGTVIKQVEEDLWHPLCRKGKSGSFRSGAAPAPGPSPTAHDLTRALGLRPQTVRQHLEALARKGLVVLYPQGHGRPTHVELTPEGGCLRASPFRWWEGLPAGPLEEALEEVEGLIPLPARPNLFALVVEGDSMAEYLLDGDVVVVERGVRPRRGEIAAVLHEGRPRSSTSTPKGT